MTINAFGVNTPRPSSAGCLILILLLIILAPIWLPLAVLVMLAVVILRLLGVVRTPKNVSFSGAASGEPVKGPERGCSGGGNPPANEDIIDVKPLSDDK